MVKKTKEPVSDNQLVAAMEPVRQFALDSYRLVKRCTKPDMKGAAFVTVCSSYAVGNDTIFPALTLSACFLCAFFGTEFKKIALATAVGFLVMGFLGFAVKLVHIPINNLIVAS